MEPGGTRRLPASRTGVKQHTNAKKMADRQPPRCTIYKNQDDRGDGQLILVTGTLEEFILKCGTKLKVESPTAVRIFNFFFAFAFACPLACLSFVARPYLAGRRCLVFMAFAWPGEWCAVGGGPDGTFCLPPENDINTQKKCCSMILLLPSLPPP